MGLCGTPEQLGECLEKELFNTLQQVAMTGQDIDIVQQCLHELQRIVHHHLGQGWRIRAFGSIAHGFGVHGSDLDATCFFEGGEPFVDAQELQRRLVPLLWASGRFEVMEEIWAARIPILKLRFDRALEVDLSSQNTEPFPNTQLLKAYGALHSKVRDTAILVKLWAKTEGVCGASNGHLSAYALTLMVIYFMQVDPELQMPCLATSAFTGGEEIPAPVKFFAWCCNLSRYELLRRFFNFYAPSSPAPASFQWGTEVVSVRTGKRMAASEPTYSQLRGRLTVRLHVEDPFVSRNLHCTLHSDKECVLYQKMWDAANALQNGALPPSLIRPPKVGPAMPHHAAVRRALAVASGAALAAHGGGGGGLQQATGRLAAPMDPYTRASMFQGCGAIYDPARNGHWVPMPPSVHGGGMVPPPTPPPLHEAPASVTFAAYAPGVAIRGAGGAVAMSGVAAEVKRPLASKLAGQVDKRRPTLESGSETESTRPGAVDNSAFASDESGKDLGAAVNGGGFEAQPPPPPVAPPPAVKPPGAVIPGAMPPGGGRGGNAAAPQQKGKTPQAGGDNITVKELAETWSSPQAGETWSNPQAPPDNEVPLTSIGSKGVLAPRAAPEPKIVLVNGARYSL